MSEEEGTVQVRDNLDALLKALPADIRQALVHHPHRKDLLEVRVKVVLDLGRQPEARFLNQPGGEFLREAPVTNEDLRAAEAAVGAFGRDNRAGIAGTLHRISAIRNRRGAVIGLTCRIGRAVSGHADMLRDLVESHKSVLLLGRPGVGKTTVIREIARLLSDEMRRRVVIVDTSNEIGGDGDVPHPAIGGARRMQVPDPGRQHHIMIEAVENHTPQVIIVDEIGSEAEALACRTIAERGITLIGTAHGRILDNLIKNPTLNDLVGGIHAVTLGDEAAKTRGSKKTVLERKAPPTFPIVVEIRDRSFYVAHWTQDSVDALLQGKVPSVQVRERNHITHEVTITSVKYDQVADPDAAKPPGRSAYDADYSAALASKQEKERELREKARAAAAASSNAVPFRVKASQAEAAAKDYGSSSGSSGSGEAGEASQSAQEEQGTLMVDASGVVSMLRASLGRDLRGFGSPSAASAAASAPPHPPHRGVVGGSAFMKPHVTVLLPRGPSGGRKRGKGRAC